VTLSQISPTLWFPNDATRTYIAGLLVSYGERLVNAAQDAPSASGDDSVVTKDGLRWSKIQPGDCYVIASGTRFVMDDPQAIDNVALCDNLPTNSKSGAIQT
jgi:hypothetical protein